MKNEDFLSSLTLRFVGRAKDDLNKALKKHMELHEGVNLFDLLKFLYQSSLGSFHLLEIMDEVEVLNWIRKNLKNTRPLDGTMAEELYGKKWVRINFGPYKMKYGNDYQRIHRAFVKNKKMKRRQPAEFGRLLERLIDAFRKRRIQSVAETPIDLRIVVDFLREYKEKGYPPVHHSKSYMLKNRSDYLVIPRSSLGEMTCTDPIENEPVASHDVKLDNIVNRAVEFHGHLGPFLVLGVRAGLVANSRLGKDCFKTRAVVTTDPSPPNSCFVDGIQFVTGCTMGKRNIKLRRGKGVSVLFTKSDQKLRLEVRNRLLESLGNIKFEKRSEEEATRLKGASSSELFKIGK